MTKQQSRRLTGIRGKFLFGLAAILVFFSTLVSVTIYFFQKQALEEEAYRQASLIMTAMDASRGYVRDVLRPKMYEVLGEEEFILEAMSSSYISRAIMELVSNEVDNFSYRRVSINARNPKYEAGDLEQEMIRYFTENDHAKEWHDIVVGEGGERTFMQFQPVRFNESCLHCHGQPEDAPLKIIESYGEDRGFHRQAGQVAGVVSVGLPVDLNLIKIKEFAFVVFSTVVPSILMLYIVISLFFNRLIAQNLRLLLNVFQTNLKDEQGKALLEKSQTLDEIEELTGVAETIADHLEKSKQTVEQYADEILRSKDLLQSVFDGITDPVLLLDKKEKTIKTVNKAFVELYQTSFKEVLGQDITSLPFKDSCPIAQCSEILDKVTSQPLSKEMQMANGLIYRIYFYPVRNETLETENIVCYVKNITDQRKLEMHIQHTEKLVSMGQLAAGVAHEINNPLGVILCHLDLVKDEATLSKEAKEDLEIIEKHVGNCRNIIADLLRFARQSKPALVSGSINDVIREVVSIAGNQMGMQSIQLEMSLDDKVPDVPIDPDRMRQVFLNLLLNGAQAIEEQGVITFSSKYEPESEQIVIVVEDNGCGIPEDVQDKIFDPFFTTKVPGKGTGLGLSVSYSIVQEHGGSISIESSIKDSMTRFIITLPVEVEVD
jgi:signal transduction histidine kinase